MPLAPMILGNAYVRLRPFEPERDGPELYALAERAPEIFRLWSYRGPGDWVGDWIEVIRKRTLEGTARSPKFSILMVDLRMPRVWRPSLDRPRH